MNLHELLNAANIGMTLIGILVGLALIVILMISRSQFHKKN